VVEEGSVGGVVGAPADAGVAGAGVAGGAGVRPCLRDIHDHHPLPSIPPEVTECQMPGLMRKLGRVTRPGSGELLREGDGWSRKRRGG
jgi:hypothetical protein